MQITLNQDEIETALRRYVNDQVNIREGHEITIDLKAGRGENGFSATIDIVPAGSGTPVKTPEPASPTKPVTISKVRSTTSAPVPDGPETAQEGAGEAAGETATETQTEGQTAQDDAAAADSGDQEAAPATEGEGKKPQSLFANLSKPRN